jgi:hypothetical protein
MIALVWALGCSGGSTSADSGDDPFTWGMVGDSTAPTTDTTTPGTDTDTDTVVTTLPGGLHGTAPPVNLPPPTLTQVLAMDGTPRTEADLLGHPTVMWFYPAAFTGG